MPRSYEHGKEEFVAYVRLNYPTDSRILDAGAGNGNGTDRMPEFTNIDAIEIFEKYITQFKLEDKYNTVFNMDIRNFEAYGEYDLVLMGDVLEHLTVEDAQKLLAKIDTDVLITVPWKYPQGAFGGNEHETHHQEDLTKEVMAERYPDLIPIIILPMLGTYLKRGKR